MTIWNDCPAVEQVPGRASGAWVFSGTRVPLFALYENLASGATIKEFVEWFPGVDERQVRAVLEHEANAEQRLSVDEILECFRPDVVLFQSPRFRRWPRRLREEARRRGGLPTGMPEEMRVVYHPAYRGRRRPRDVVKARC